MTQRITARFGELDGLAGTIDRTVTEIRTELDTLNGQVAALTELWTGSAADGFQHTLALWRSAADDLRDGLDRLGRIVRTTHGNYRNAVTTNTRMWPTP